ncbi:tubulin-specific chaperone E-like [Octopus vulgaris]|uniref:Tubulin-specific chaperone E n=1 Tax=Octopus vulgaris TaxID=6645 RepID=A0AA36BK42_OCTVU|nr:tubulin-specific chaperone E-like [Octopus vulgaris]
MNRNDGSELVIGDRIECDDYFGTIKYIGEVDAMEGVWFGIDWDEIHRGKHDGSYKGRRYFQAGHPKSGSFIKPIKAKLGQSFPDAYVCKHGDIVDVRSRILILDNYVIYGLGSQEVTSQFSAIASKITELDLSGNLLKNWTQVAEITNLIPNLLKLNVSNNRLIIPEHAENLSKSFAKVEDLVLNRMNYDWVDILSATSMFPSLRGLYVCFNNLEKLADSTGKLTNLKFLSLIDNRLSDWNELLKLGQLPQLSTLSVNNNQLTAVSFNDVPLEDGEKTTYFPSLKCLDLSSNLIDNLSSIDELSKLANLTEFSFLHNPTADIDEDKLFNLIIAKIGSLKKYAKTIIHDEKQKDAEIFYLRMIEKQALEKNISEEDLTKTCSRYKELGQKYGYEYPEKHSLQSHLTDGDIPEEMIRNKKLFPDMNRNDGSKLVIGDRIESENCFGTIKYIGEVDTMEGIWFGIDWDEIHWGKHDGSYKGRRYYQASHPKSGSFINPLHINLGQSFPDAYACKAKDVLIMTPRILFLNNYGVYGLGSQEVTSQFSSIASKLTELDLSTNLLKSWTQVVEIANIIPNLILLNVSSNRLIIPENVEMFAKSFTNVEELILNRMDYNWANILSVTSMFPSLQRLYASFNNLETFIDSTGKLTKLKFLSLSNNRISDENELLKFGQLPQLSTLYVNNNQLTSVSFNDVSLEDGKKTSHFRSLECLSLNKNDINNRSSIDELSKLANLTELILANNPLGAVYKDKLFYITVGKIGSLKKYDKTLIRDEERKNAEVYYLDMVEREALEKNIGEEDTAKTCSRYKELVKKYGHASPESLITKTILLQDKLIAVDIQTDNIPDKVLKNKKLSPDITILKLKSLVQKLFKIQEMTNLKLSYISRENPEVKVELDNDFKPLSHYSIENGDSLIAKW